MAGWRVSHEQVTPTAGPTLDPQLVEAVLTLVSHDLRTPLNAVIGFSDCMERQLFGPLGDERYEAYARHIRESGTALLRIAEQTLALAALTAGSAPQCVSNFALAAMVNDVVGELAPLVPGLRADITAEVAPEIMVRHNADVIRLALGYLVNAGLLPHAQLSLRAHAGFGTVHLRLQVIGSADAVQPLPSYLTLAKVLFQGQGCAVTVGVTDAGWAASVCLTEAAQRDLF